ncbi:hypothetical protein [Actinokineospora iranica]|uniref:hypothetical protein n=1 Tax=Actinokineospora iranica TaxID=1271860 RepID=UPI0011138B2F|nr:hypothetical protein [Actinokineospora iranica]
MTRAAALDLVEDMRKLPALVAVVSAAALGVTAPGVGQADAPRTPSAYLGSVTLVTGDHVTVRRVGERLVPAVDPGPGREHIQFATAGAGPRLLVVPSDA